MNWLINPSTLHAVNLILLGGLFGYLGIKIKRYPRVICRSVVMSPRQVLKPSDLGFALDQIPTGVNLKFARKAIEKDFVQKALYRNGGIVSRTARELAVSRVNLYELIAKYEIRIQEFKTLKTAGRTQIKGREVS